MLVRPLDDGSADRVRLKGRAVLAQKAQALEIVRRKRARNEPRITDPHFPEIGVEPVCQKTERNKRLPFANFGDVVAKLLFTFAGTTASAFCFDHPYDVTIGAV